MKEQIDKKISDFKPDRMNFNDFVKDKDYLDFDFPMKHTINKKIYIPSYVNNRLQWTII